MLSRNYSDNVNVRTSFGTYSRFGFAARDVLNFKPLSAKVYVNVLERFKGFIMKSTSLWVQK